MKSFVQRHCDTDKGFFDPEMTFLKDGGLILWSTPQQRDDGLKDADALIAAGLGQDVTRLDNTDVKAITGSDAFYGGLQIKTTAVLWAAKFVFSLARQVQDWCHIATFCPVEGVSKGGDHFKVKTSRGTIQCSKIVYATNAWTCSILPEFKKHVIPVRNQVLQFRPPKQVKWNYCLSSNDG
jgi:glycine/D-amino acid oxidase-like deaminating enzyme